MSKVFIIFKHVPSMHSPYLFYNDLFKELCLFKDLESLVTYGSS